MVVDFNLKRFLKLILVVVLFLFLSEIICALFYPGPIIGKDILGRKVRSDSPEYQVFEEDKHKYYDFLPNSNGKMFLLNEYNYEYKINSIGLRSNEIPEDRKDSYRILVLGDSQTFGTTRQEETFSVVLEKLLNNNS